MPTSSPRNGGRTLRYAEALAEATAIEMENDERVFVMGLDVDDHKAIQGSTAWLRETFGPERVFTTPLSEDAMTGVAVGAAMAGMRPIHVHIRMDFLLLCMNQLVNVAAKARYMYGGQASVPLTVRAMIGKSWGQGAQHSQGLHAMLMHVPGLKIAAPSNAYDAKGCLAAAVRDDDPTILVEHRLLYPTEAYVPEEVYLSPIGRARIAAPGDDVTLVGISNMVGECLRARELLAEAGVSAEVIDPVWLAPLDIDTVVASAAKTRRLVVVDSAWTSCGASAEIAARAAEALGGDGPFAVRRIGFAPTTCPTSPPLERLFYPTPASVAEAVHALVRPGRARWRPDPTHAEPVHQAPFRGPF